MKKSDRDRLNACLVGIQRARRSRSGSLLNLFQMRPGCRHAPPLGDFAHPAAERRHRADRKKVYRFTARRLTMRKRGGRKRALRTRASMTIPQGAESALVLNFVSDALANSRRFRILTVVDDFSRECLALVVDHSLSASVSPPSWTACPRCAVCLHGGQRQRHRADLTRHPRMAGSAAWNDTTSRLASRPRTASANPSMAGRATSASTSTCLPTLPKPDGSKHGRPTTTPDDHTRA